MQPTNDPHINDLLKDLLSRMQEILGEKLLGLYLFGSLSYGDFDPKRSDIDLLAVVKVPVSDEEREQLKRIHEEIEHSYPAWNERVECSYTPVEMFENILPPKEPRPYIGGGIFYPEARYGNEWIINNYLLYKHGISLFGPDFKTLVQPIDIVDVQKASVKDLFKEWEPKITDYEWLSNGHYQSYLVLNLCRILYTVICAEVGSKNVSATWVKSEFPKWRDLIETAEDWEYGRDMKKQDETIEFIKFAIEKVKAKQQILA